MPPILTTEEVAALARVGLATVRRAVFETRHGLRGPGSPWYLPRAQKVRAGFLREDVLRWLEARGQISGGGTWVTRENCNDSRTVSAGCELHQAAANRRRAKAG